jgi:hypothetical protein
LKFTKKLFFSRDITIPRPVIGDYYFLLVGLKDFHELLITAILVSFTRKLKGKLAKELTREITWILTRELTGELTGDLTGELTS